MNLLANSSEAKRLQATVTLEYKDKKTAMAVAAAVSPDNFKTPPELQVKTSLENTKVVTTVDCEGKLATFTATIDDLLFSASTAEKTLAAVRRI
jgi:hypothetical protein